MAVIIGTAAGESLTGTGGADRIEALGGNDYVLGAGGDDVLLGGDDNDQLEGGAGDDRIEGGLGADYMLGGVGNDTLIGGEGNDTLYDGEGSDIFEMGGGNNYASLTYYGSVGYNVQLTGGDGTDRVRLVSYGPTSFTMDLGAGNDEIGIEVLAGPVTLTLGAGSDTIGLTWYHPGPPMYPSTGLITVTDFETGAGGDSVDFLSALTIALTNWDHDLNPFGTGSGSGHLRLVQEAGNAVLQIDRDGGGDSFATFMIFEDRSVADFTPDNFDGFPTDGNVPAGLSIVGTDSNDRLFGWSGDDTISGGLLHDVVYGGAGGDMLIGDEGHDQLYGELGDDQLDGGAGDDSLDGGLGDDILNGEDGSDNLRTDSGNDILDGGAGTDTLFIHAVSEGTGRGGTGNDSIWLSSTSLGGLFEIDGGGDSDRINIQGARGRVNVTLGAGADVLALGNLDAAATLADGDIVVSDFETGAGGDSVEFKLLLTALDAGWNGSDNPFGSGHARLVEDGPDTLLQIDANGGGNSWHTAVTFTGRSPASFTAANFEGFAPDGSPPPGLVLTGTAGADTLRGGAGGDTIDGLAGQDFLVGDAGDDTIRGGDDEDSIEGGGGNDLLEGGAGGDRLDDAAGDDVARGGAGNDSFWNEFGNDELDGGADADTFTVQRMGSQSDTVTLNAGSGNDWAQLNIYGASHYRADMGEGDDRLNLYANNGTVEITLGAGADVIGLLGVSLGGSQIVSVLDFAAGAGGDSFYLDYFFSTVFTGWNGSDNPFDTGRARLLKSGPDMIFQVDQDGGGDNYRNVVTLKNVSPSGFTAANFGWAPSIVYGEYRIGGAGNDVLSASEGDDILDGGAGADSMSGGRGDDSYVVDNAGDSVIEAAGEGRDEIRTTLASYSLIGLPNVENLTAINGVSHDFRGNSGDNRILGGGVADLLRLQDGGDDTVYGGGGNDNLFFIGSLTSADYVNGGEGTDTLVLQGAYGSLTLTADVIQIENISILGGNNTAFGEPGTNRHDYVLTTNDANFAPGVQARINGSALLAGEDFTFDGSAETDALFVVYGGKGRDTLTGGLGNDIFFYAEDRFASGDTVNGGSGYDGMFLRGNYTIDFTAPGYTGLFTSIENLTLTSATDERYARGGGTEFDYNLTLSDAIVGAGQVLTVSGALLMASETMVFDAGAETDGILRLFGGKASDTLKGGALADLIHGNLGADILTGNGGADAFRYQNIGESSSGSMDQILDFTTGTDKIELDRIDANSLVAGNQAFAWIGSDAFTGSAGQLRAHEQGGTWFVEGDVNGDSVADLVIALTIPNAAPLGAGDFIL